MDCTAMLQRTAFFLSALLFFGLRNNGKWPQNVEIATCL
jgi:hypothetical protein